MRKSTLFISAMLTVFLIAILFGVVSAYQQMTQTAASDPAPKAAAAQPMSAVFPAAFTPTPTPLVVVSPEQATTIATEFLGNSEVYSVEVVNYEGAQAFLVTFSSGDLVYVSSDGKVLSNTKVEPVVVVASGGGGGGNQSNTEDGNTGGGNTQSSGGESEDDDHEDHDEHEDHGDDD